MLYFIARTQSKYIYSTGMITVKDYYYGSKHDEIYILNQKEQNRLKEFYFPSSYIVFFLSYSINLAGFYLLFITCRKYPVRFFVFNSLLLILISFFGSLRYYREINKNNVEKELSLHKHFSGFSIRSVDIDILADLEKTEKNKREQLFKIMRYLLILEILIFVLSSMKYNAENMLVYLMMPFFVLTTCFTYIDCVYADNCMIAFHKRITELKNETGVLSGDAVSVPKKS